MSLKGKLEMAATTLKHKAKPSVDQEKEDRVLVYRDADDDEEEDLSYDEAESSEEEIKEIPMQPSKRQRVESEDFDIYGSEVDAPEEGGLDDSVSDDSDHKKIGIGARGSDSESIHESDEEEELRKRLAESSDESMEDSEFDSEMGIKQ